MSSENLVPKAIAFFLGIIIPISFVIYVDWIKKIAAKKLIRKKDENNFDDYSKMLEYELKEKQSYREAELKFFLPYSIIYIIILILFLLLLGPYFNFDIIEIYFSSKYNKTIKEKIIGTITILIINFVLYSGLLIQFLFGNESLYPKTKFTYFMENFYGPLIEEIIYRGILFTIFINAGFNGYKSAVYSSLTFSLSHFRHVFDIYYNKNLAFLFFQSFYTLLFGFYTCYVYHYSGCIFAPVLLHCVCNTLQMPRFNYLKDCSLSKFKKNLISFTYIAGILGWILLIKKYH